MLMPPHLVQEYKHKWESLLAVIGATDVLDLLLNTCVFIEQAKDSFDFKTILYVDDHGACNGAHGTHSTTSCYRLNLKWQNSTRYTMVKIVPLMLFTDDTSGNISKQYNNVDSWSMVCGALPLEEICDSILVGPSIKTDFDTLLSQTHEYNTVIAAPTVSLGKRRAPDDCKAVIAKIKKITAIVTLPWTSPRTAVKTKQMEMDKDGQLCKSKSDGGGYSWDHLQMRLIPKDNDSRVINEMKKAKTLVEAADRSTSLATINNNEELQCVKTAMDLEAFRQADIMEDGAKSVRLAVEQLAKYKEQLCVAAGSAQSLYFCKVDIQNCSDTIDQQKLLRYLDNVFLEVSCGLMCLENTEYLLTFSCLFRIECICDIYNDCSSFLAASISKPLPMTVYSEDGKRIGDRCLSTIKKTARKSMMALITETSIKRRDLHNELNKDEQLFVSPALPDLSTVWRNLILLLPPGERRSHRIQCCRLGPATGLKNTWSATCSSVSIRKRVALGESVELSLKRYKRLFDEVLKHIDGLILKSTQAWQAHRMVREWSQFLA
ncbi:hypothetical protein [Absidia glauca]|uniref:Uncharacterized protein n=1 Tax=Absidia glauca TaxID=4829 RepID=A0A168N5Q9_ABSGL|nr:hypothetical protein [Absidia glauca]